MSRPDLATDQAPPAVRRLTQKVGTLQRFKRTQRVVLGLSLFGAAMLAMTAGAGAQEVEEPPIDAAAVKAMLDNAWILVAAVLVIFMQAGFALVEAGLTRGKNVANIMMKNLMDFVLGVLVFAAVGFAIAFGGDGPLVGTSGWFLNSETFDFAPLTLPTFFVFQVAFAATAATIVSGAMAERTKFVSYLIYSAVISAVIYPVVVHWVWGGGWLSQRETAFVDFAGSTVVHSVGGWAALMGAAILGPRIGKYGKDGKPRAIPGHSIPFAVLGTIILLIGWFGFNPGSELQADLELGGIALTTLLSGVAGALVAMIVIWIQSGKPDVAMTCNGLLAGLVGITAGCFVISGPWSVLVGAISGALVVGSVLFFDRVKIDDPVGAISVHGICGVWGTLAVGLFADRDDVVGLFMGGGSAQLVTQVIGIVAVAAFTLVASGILFTLIKVTVGLRVTAEEEIEGLDSLEHGSPGYAGDVVTTLPTEGTSSPSERPISVSV